MPCWAVTATDNGASLNSHDRLGYQGSELVAQEHPIAVADLNQVDRDQLLLRIDPKDGPRVAGPTVLTDAAREARYAHLFTHLKPKAKTHSRILPGQAT